MPKIAWIAGTATVTTVAFCVWRIGEWGAAPLRLAVDDVGLVVLSGFATACAAFAVRRSSGRQRAAWICFAIGLAGWTAGSGLWAYYEWWLGVSPFPSPADIGHLMLPVFVCIGLLALPVGASGYTHARLLLDGFIVAASLFEIAWLTIMGTFLAAGGASAFELGLSLSYPIADLMAVTVALLVLGRGHTGHRTELALVTAGIVAIALADCAVVYMTSHADYTAAGIVEVGWAGGLLMIGVAALVRAQTPHGDVEVPQAPSRIAVWLPYVPIVIAVVVSIVKFAAIPGLPPVLVVSVLLMIAVLLRQSIVVGENRRLLATVSARAMRDPLTGLANRALFQDRLSHAVLLHQRDKQSLAVLSLDLDDFKLVNDGLGHPAGDVLLALAAKRIRRSTRTSDTVARLGGDEFAVLMEGDVEQSRLVAHQVSLAFDEPFVVDGHSLQLRPSAGLALASPGGPELSADALLKQADVAMYSAKRSRCRGVLTYRPEMEQVERHDTDTCGTHLDGAAHDGPEAFQLLGQLRHAIDNFGLTLVYQPKFDLRDESIVGVETLVRWPHPDRGMLGPDQFLSLVREHGLMRSVTELVLTQALDQAALWRAHGVAVPIAVNVFAPSLSDLTLPDRIMRALDDRKLSYDTLTVEVTEDLLLDNIDRARSVMKALRDRGVRIAIDDFGSGYSALSYLRDLHIDEVKLDREFVTTVLVDARAGAIVRAVIDLAHELGLTTVAEGVEDAATASLLREYGCKYAQGYYYSAPLAAKEMFALLTSRLPVPR